MITPLPHMPRRSAVNSSFWEASSRVLTRKEPRMEARIPTEARAIGMVTPLNSRPAATARAAVEITEPT